jgi:hypothetical protein
VTLWLEIKERARVRRKNENTLKRSYGIMHIFSTSFGKGKK